MKPVHPCLLVLAIAAGIATGCNTIHSTLRIEPGQQFVLGGGSRGAFVVDARNVGTVPVAVAQQLPSGQTDPLGVLAPGQSDQLRFPAGAAALLENTSSTQARLALKIGGDTDLGMRYEPKP
jgi:hypothetical protein